MIPLHNKTAILCCLLSIASITSKAQTRESTDLYYQTGRVHPLMVQYDADKGSLARFYRVTNSPERRERFKSFNEDYLKQLQQLDFDKLTSSDKADYILFKRGLTNELRLLDIEEKEYGQIIKYVSFGDYIYQLEKIRRRGASLPAPEVAGKLADISNQVTALIQSTRAEESIPKELVTRLEGTIRGLQLALKSIYEFYYNYDPSFTWWIPQPYKKLDGLLNDYANLVNTRVPKEVVQKDDGSGIIGNPIGNGEIIRQLQYEMIPYTPEELIGIAEKEFAWCDAEMLKASREMGFGNDWKKALEKVKNTYVPAGKQPELIMRLYNESIDFLKKNDLVTIPPIAEETWRMVMMSPEQQLVAPFFLGGEVLLIAYPTADMDFNAKQMSFRGNNPHFSRAVVHHELIAGHHLQGFMNDRYKPYRNFNTPFWTEGWALYWEMILWDKQFPRSAEDKVGMLFWRMHRCARIIFSLNYHLGKWTPQQCIDFLVDRVGHERANAEGEVRRSFTGRYGPLYQLAYMIGALQFYALKKELVDGGKMTLKQYNDAVLRENNMPVEMVRAILTGQPLSRDYKTSWRFYGK